MPSTDGTVEEPGRASARERNRAPGAVERGEMEKKKKKRGGKKNEIGRGGGWG